MPDWLGPFLLGVAFGGLVTWNVHARWIKERLTLHRIPVGGTRAVLWSLNLGRALIATGSKDYLERRKRRIEEAIDGRLGRR